jgi:ABC-type multidrug transport system fused ATPase/permease subunit
MAHSKFAGLVGFIEFRLQLRLSQALNHLLRSQLFERIQQIPLPLLNDQRIGDSLYRVMYDTTAIGNVFYQVILSPPLSVFGAIVVLYVLTTTYGDAPEVVWLALLILPLQVLAILPFPRLLRRRSQASRAAGAATTGNIEEGMSNVLAVQSLGGNARERKRFQAASRESFKRHRAQVFIEILLGISRSAASSVVGFVAFYVISGGVIEGRLTPGDYGVLFFYYTWLAGSLGYLPFIWARIQESVPGIRRVFFLMDLPSELDRDGETLAAVQQGVHMQNVGFVYPDGRRALSDIELTANVGEVTALVGPTGAGKTSLGLLLAGLHDPSEGVIEFDGCDVGAISLISLRAQVSFVFQEPQLFSLSIIENIRYANPSATQQDVERVARSAGAHDFISAFPDGYATPLGTVTSKLSVGQKQRIAIARGLLKASSVLILDEPTSALDPETEAYLVDALRDAARDRLVIIIAHRLSTIAHADQIIFLDEGRIVERGRHEDLMNLAGGHYRQYVIAQT